MAVLLFSDGLLSAAISARGILGEVITIALVYVEDLGLDQVVVLVGVGRGRVGVGEGQLPATVLSRLIFFLATDFVFYSLCYLIDLLH